MQLYFENHLKSSDGTVAVIPLDIKSDPSLTLTQLCNYLESNGWHSEVLKTLDDTFVWVYVSPPNICN